MNILDQLIVIARYQMVTALRYRNGAPFRLVAGAVEIASAYFLARAVGPQFRPDGISFFAFLLTGTSFYIYLLAVVGSCVSFVDEAQRSGTIEVLMATPTPPLQVLLLHAAPVVAWRTAGMIAYLACGMWLVKSDALHVNFAAAFAVFALMVLIATALGLVGAAMQLLFFRGSLLVWALGILGGMFMGSVFPVSVLPAPLQWIATVLPLRAPLDALRSALLQNASIGQLSGTIIHLMIAGTLLSFAGIVCFQSALRRALRTGSLSFY